MNMRSLIGFLAVWGIADSIWLAFFPASWASWWGRFIVRMGRGGVAPRIVALWEFVLSLALLAAASSGRIAVREARTTVE
jgi:hypothetical protein